MLPSHYTCRNSTKIRQLCRRRHRHYIFLRLHFEEEYLCRSYGAESVEIIKLVNGLKITCLEFSWGNTTIFSSLGIPTGSVTLCRSDTNADCLRHHLNNDNDTWIWFLCNWSVQNYVCTGHEYPVDLHILYLPSLWTPQDLAISWS